MINKPVEASKTTAALSQYVDVLEKLYDVQRKSLEAQIDLANKTLCNMAGTEREIKQIDIKVSEETKKRLIQYAQKYEYVTTLDQAINQILDIVACK